MTDFIESVRVIANRVQEQAVQAGDLYLYTHADRALKLAEALDRINQVALKSHFSQVDIKLYCYGKGDGDVIDYEIEGHDADGFKSHIASDIAWDTIPVALVEISRDEDIEALIKETEQ